jgi:hypothetical protein
MNGAFPPAGFGPGFDQMPMMMAGFGGFPMMGTSTLFLLIR